MLVGGEWALVRLANGWHEAVRAGCVERAVRRHGSAVYVVAPTQARFRIGRLRRGPCGFVWLRAYAACTSLGALRESTRPMNRPIAAGAIQPRPIV